MSRDLRLCLAIVFAFCFTMSANLLVVPLISTRLGVTESGLGLILAIPGLIVAIGALPASVLSNYTGRRLQLMVSFAFGALASLFYATSSGPLGIMVGQLANGCSLAIFWPSVVTLFSELAPAGMQAQVQGRNTVFQGLGLLTAPVLAGWLVDHWGFGPLFIVYFTVSMVGLACTFALRPLPLPRPPLAPLPAMLRSYRSALELLRMEPGLRVSGLGQFLTLALTQTVGGGFAILFLKQQGMTPALVGMIMTMREIAQTVSRAVFPRLARRFTVEQLLISAPILGALGILGVVVSPISILLFVAVAVQGFGLGLNAPASNTLVALRTPPDQRAIGMGLTIVAAQLGTVVVPPIVGAIASLAGVRVSIVISSTLVLLIALRFYRTLPAQGPRASVQGGVSL